MSPVSILGGGMGGFTHIFENSPVFSEEGGKFYIEKEGKRSTNVINSHFSIKIPTVFQILE
jgi:hypothetical protein